MPAGIRFLCATRPTYPHLNWLEARSPVRRLDLDSALYNLLDRRHGHVSTAVTSNIALSDWGRYLGDVTLTAAILDRLAMHAIRIDITGPSWRQHVAKTRAASRAPKT